MYAAIKAGIQKIFMAQCQKEPKKNVIKKVTYNISLQFKAIFFYSDLICLLAAGWAAASRTIQAVGKSARDSGDTGNAKLSHLGGYTLHRSGAMR